LFPAAITLKLLEAVARPEPSQCELEVLHFIASGRSNKEIGNVLYISEFTVKGHVRSILEKARGEGPF
jgi:DNA-binding NarL/FixJ family response regulator